MVGVHLASILERYVLHLVLTRFGGDLLSHVLRRSTIGATVLNFRVRDGTGCITRAMTTKPRKSQMSKSSILYVYAFDVQSIFYWIKSSLSGH